MRMNWSNGHYTLPSTSSPITGLSWGWMGRCTWHAGRRAWHAGGPQDIEHLGTCRLGSQADPQPFLNFINRLSRGEWSCLYWWHKTTTYFSLHGEAGKSLRLPWFQIPGVIYRNNFYGIYSFPSNFAIKAINQSQHRISSNRTPSFMVITGRLH